MKTYFFNPNLAIIVPLCCEMKHHEAFRNKILSALEKINQTRIGHELLDKIAQGIHRIEISTHPLTDECVVRSQKLFFARVANKEAAADPKRGSGSFLFIDPDFKQPPPKYFTQHHYKFCVSKHLISKGCGKDTSCSRSPNFIRILFHELAHAEHNQKGMNQRHLTSVPQIYKNAEELQTIELENTFAVELEELEKGEPLPDKEKDLVKRFGFFSPDNPTQKEQLEKAKSVEVVHFLRFTAPQIISFVGQTVSSVHTTQEPKQVPNASSVIDTDDDIYNINSI